MTRMPLSDAEIELAKQSRKRDLHELLLRLNGEIDASAKGAAAMARVNESARHQRDAAAAELTSLGAEPAGLDRYGRFSLLDRAMEDERAFVKGRGYDWLTENPLASFEDTTATLEAAAVEYAQGREGRCWVLLRYESVLAEWMANAVAAKKCGEGWGAFRDYLLAIGRSSALGLDS